MQYLNPHQENTIPVLRDLISARNHFSYASYDVECVRNLSVRLYMSVCNTYMGNMYEYLNMYIVVLLME